jgi:hyperosmotically inducible periplasmic protein
MRRRTSLTLIRAALAGGVATFAILAASATPIAQSIAEQETAMSVRRALERLPYYGVFDFLTFEMERGTVTLRGYTYRGDLKTAAANAVKRVSGVDEVENEIEVLPASQYDDRIRWATFYRIYTDDFLSRYAPGGALGARRAAIDAARFPGLQPFGDYPLHIIVKGGRTTLIGFVDNAGDKQIAEVRAREIGGVFKVTNDLVVITP